MMASAFFNLSLKTYITNQTFGNPFSSLKCIFAKKLACVISTHFLKIVINLSLIEKLTIMLSFVSIFTVVQLSMYDFKKSNFMSQEKSVKELEIPELLPLS